MNSHAIEFVVILLYLIGVGIYRFVRWLAKQIGGGAAGPSPAELARQRMLAEAQRTATGQAPPATGQAARATGSYRPSQPFTQTTPPRQPQAGGPAVPVEATTREFQTQTRQMFAEEPTPIQTPLASTAAVSLDAGTLTLFNGPDDLLRAIILQEVLGPPLCRRRQTPAPLETPPAA